MTVLDADTTEREEEIGRRSFEAFVREYEPSDERRARFSADLHYLIARLTEMRTRSLMKYVVDFAARQHFPSFFTKP